MARHLLVFLGLAAVICSLQYSVDGLRRTQVQYKQRHNSPGRGQRSFWRTMLGGIYPGTKWCGLGHMAGHYDDLGNASEADKCCREHDHCPVKIRAFRKAYGLRNWSMYTKSSCECDIQFYNCLKEAGTSTANALGDFYFNIWKIQCIVFEEDNYNDQNELENLITPINCILFNNLTDECELWDENQRPQQRRQVRNRRQQRGFNDNNHSRKKAYFDNVIKSY